MSVYFHPIYNAVLVICLGLAVMGTVMRTEKMVHDLIFSLPLKSIEEEKFSPAYSSLCMLRARCLPQLQVGGSVRRHNASIGTEMIREIKSSLFHWIFSLLCIRYIFNFHLTDTLQTYFLLFSLLDFLLPDGPIQTFSGNWPSCLWTPDRVAFNRPLG